jgi:hypothetical protein
MVSELAGKGFGLASCCGCEAAAGAARLAVTVTTGRKPLSHASFEFAIP